MPDHNSTPVVLLFYVNTGEAPDSFKLEAEAIESNLKALKICDVRIVPVRNLADVIIAINEPATSNRVAIVHYTGHKNERGIQLQSSNEAAPAQAETEDMRDLVQVLATLPHLRLLFINGCASREQVLELTRIGIPLVVATKGGIDDEVAHEFVECFYRTLGQQRSIADAFQVASGQVESATGENDHGLDCGEFQASAPASRGELPWEIHGPDVARNWSLQESSFRGTVARWDHTEFTFKPESPYLGLRHFSEEESSRFFGRDEFVQTLLAAGESAPLVLVIGASGTGKTSVVRAGMIPHWKRRHGGESRVRAFVFTPQDDPFEQLSTALAAVDSFDRQLVRRIREMPSRTALRDAVKTFGQGEQWLFFVDQLEQIFTRTIDQKKRAAFLDAVVDLAKSKHPNVCLVLAMRDDFFPLLQGYPELFPLTDRHCFRVAALSRAALREVIERPAAEHGVAFQPGLVGNIVDDVDRQSGALPLLQYTLDALWKAGDLSGRLLDETTYGGLGGVTESLGHRLQNLYEQQDLVGKDQFRKMMLKLVSFDGSASGNTAILRLAAKSEFEGKQAELLDQMIGQDWVISSDTSTPSVQLVHEVVLAAWPEFAKWAREHLEANTVRQQLSKAACDWCAYGERGDRRKAIGTLWQGSRLEQALELRQRGDFADLGELDSNDERFLDASRRRSRLTIRGPRWSVGAALALLAFSVGIGGFGWWSYGRAETARGQAAENASEASRQQADAYWQLGVIARERNLGLASAFNFLRAAQACEKAGEIGYPVRQRNIEFAAQFPMSHLIRSFPHDAGVWGVRVNGNESQVLTYGSDGWVKLWDAAKTEPLQAWKHEDAVNGAVFNRDDSRVLAWSRDGAVKLWDVKQAEPLQVWKHEDAIKGATLTRDESRFLAWSADGVIKLWDLTQAEPLRIWKHEDAVRKATFTRDESRFLAWSADGVLKLWDVTQAEPVRAWKPEAAVRGAVFTRDGSRILAWRECGAVELWDVQQAEPLRVWKHDRNVVGAVFTRDETRILTWSSDGRVKLCDVTQAEPLRVWEHDSYVHGATFNRDETCVLTWSGDFQAGEVKLWDVTQAEPLGTWNHQALVSRAVFTRDESRILTWSLDRTMKLWDVTKTQPLQTWKSDSGINAAMFTHDESRVLAWNGQDAAMWWDVPQAEPHQAWQHRGSVSGAVFNRDESRVLAWSDGGEVKLWDVKHAEPLQVWKHVGTLKGAVFTHDESHVLAWCWDALKLWDVTRAEPLQVWKHENSFDGVTVTRDESRVLTWSTRALMLWGVTQARPLQVWHDEAFGGFVLGAKFMSDDSRVLAWCSDGAMTLWDVTKTNPLLVWKHDRDVDGVIVTRDGFRFLSWSSDSVMELWDVTQAEPLQTWQHDDSILGAVFTRDESRVLTWSLDGAVTLWDAAHAEPVQVWRHEGAVLGAVFTRDESRVLAWSLDGAVKLWDVTQTEPLGIWKHDDIVRGAVFSRDESRFLAWSDDCALKLWDVTQAQPLHAWRKGNTIRHARFSRDESRVLAWGFDRVVLFGVTRGEPLQVWIHDDILGGATFTDDESRVLAWSEDGAVRLWDSALRNENLTPTERTTELEVRSATRLDSAGQLVPLKSAEWTALVRSPEYAAIQKKLKAAVSSDLAK